MVNSIAEQCRLYSQVVRLEAFDLHASFGNGQLGRTEERIVSNEGKLCLDTKAWKAGDVAYQTLKQLYPKGISAPELIDAAKELLSIAINDIYPLVLSRGESGSFVIEPTGVEGLKAAWAEYDWCDRLMFVFELIDDATAEKGHDYYHPLKLTLPLVLLARLDDAVIAEFMDGRGLSDVMFEIGSLKDRIDPPRHIQRLIKTSLASQEKLDSFKQARRKGADAIHVENREMKAAVFQWLETQTKFTSNEAAATSITRQQPIAHTTARDWYQEWKKLHSASRP